MRSLLVALLLLIPATAESQAQRELSRAERKEKLAKLSDAHRQFLADVEPIILPVERDTFLLLETDAQRDLYIEDFWARRDPHGNSADNAYRHEYYERLDEAVAKFKNRSNDRYRIYMLHGEPERVLDPNCGNYIVPMEIWWYSASGKPPLLLFYAPGGFGTDMRLWTPMCRNWECLEDLLTIVGQQQGVEAVFFGRVVQTPFGAVRDQPLIYTDCRDGYALHSAIFEAKERGIHQQSAFIAPKIDEEKLNRFLSSNVIETKDAPKLGATMDVAFPGRRGERTEVEVTIKVPKSGLKPHVVGETSIYLIDVTGEVLKDGRFFERFRYRFDVPIEGAAESVSATLSRFLRSADYKIRLKVENQDSGGQTLIERDLKVPTVDRVSRAARVVDEPGTDAQLRIVPLPDSAITGFRKIELIVAGDAIKVVEFYLDGKKVMTKRNPPFDLELDFGPVPKPQKVRAVGLDAKGNVVDGDELSINLGSDRLRVRIVSPRFAKKLQGNVRVELDVNVPEGKILESVELFLNETRLATLYDEPFVQVIHLPANLPVGYLRAVAKLKGEEETAEDLVLVNAPEMMQEVTVHLVELPTTVERDGKPLRDLPKDAFRVFDNNRAVEIVKFEQVRNLPLAIGLAIDSSASMRKKLGEAQKAASAFFRTVMTEKDKAFLVAFDERPHLVRQWTSSVPELESALAKIRTEESTSLWDAIVFSLYNYQQVKGQKVLVVMTDGRDTTSRFRFDQALEYAKRSGIPIYAIGLGIGLASADVKFRLGRLAAETGGATFYIETADQLSGVYSQIQDDLRSQYLLGFYPEPMVKPGSDWREVRVEVDNAKTRTVRGYYP